MNDEKDRILIAQWILERNLAWIAAADAKVGVVIAADIAIFAGLGAAFSTAKVPNTCAIILSLAAMCALTVALVNAALSLFPRTVGPTSSLIYFGRVSEMTGSEYAAALRAANVSQFFDDLAMQIQRNAEIANVKHMCVRRAIVWSFLAAIPWAFAIGLLVRG